jgi:hypothetical protein
VPKPKTFRDKLVGLFKKSSDKTHQNTIGTTLEGKIHESFTVAADRLFQSGAMNTKERIQLSGAIGDMLGRFRKSIPQEVYARKMTDRAHEHLKSAVSRQTAERVLQSRFIMSQLKGIKSPQALQRRVGRAAEVVSKKPVAQASREEIRNILRTSKFVRSRMPGAKGGEIYSAIRSAEGAKSHQMELPT